MNAQNRQYSDPTGGIASAIAARIAEKRTPGVREIVALDGRCAAGKTTLAAELEERLRCTVFHMDDYFLRPGQRTPARLAEPGGNVDRERFLCEILRPLAAGADTVVYRRFDCKTATLSPPLTVTPGPLVIVEGAYACHPDLFGYYDLRVFLSVSPGEQRARLQRRNGEEGMNAFLEKWIPLEEAYFREFGIPERCDMRF